MARSYKRVSCLRSAPLIFRGSGRATCKVEEPGGPSKCENAVVAGARYSFSNPSRSTIGTPEQSIVRKAVLIFGFKCLVRLLGI